jgi:outer membrane protein OmpA-like peptidoglycan-associated protein
MLKIPFIVELKGLKIMKVRLAILVFGFVSSTILGQSYKLSQVCFNAETNTFAPRIIGDQVYVIADSKDTSEFGRDNLDDRLYTDVYIVNGCDLDTAKLLSAKYQSELTISSRLYDGPLSSNKDVSVMFFSNNSDASLNKQMGIFYLTKDQSGWSESKSFPLNSSSHSCMHPFYDEDNKRILFVSNIIGGKGGYDIYEIPFDGDVFGQFSELANINTEFNELFPVAFEDNLYFTSDRSEGFGGLDVFMQSNNELTHFPEPVNSQYDDLAYYPISSSSAFLSSNREANADINYIVNISSKVNTNADDIYTKINDELDENLDLQLLIRDSDEIVENEFLFNMINGTTQGVKEELDVLLNKQKQNKDAIVLNSDLFKQELEQALFGEGYADVRNKLDLQDQILKMVAELNNCSNDAERQELLNQIENLLISYDENYAQMIRPRIDEMRNQYKIAELNSEELNNAKILYSESLIVKLREQAKNEGITLNEVFDRNKELLSQLGISNEVLHSATISKMTLARLVDSHKKLIVLFNFDSYRLKSEFKPYLNQLISFASDYENVNIVLEGHTDNLGSIEYNKLLSKKRANSVKKYLFANGLNRQSYSVVPFGFDKPAESNDSKTGRALNRRVEIDLILMN